MQPRRRRPGWWQVYALCGLVVLLLMLEANLAISVVGHEIVEVAILAGFFGLILGWLRFNSSGLAAEEPFQDWPPLRPTDAEPRALAAQREKPPRPIFQLPQAGLNHTLGNTFQNEAPDDQIPGNSKTGRPR